MARPAAGKIPCTGIRSTYGTTPESPEGPVDTGQNSVALPRLEPWSFLGGLEILSPCTPTGRSIAVPKVANSSLKAVAADLLRNQIDSAQFKYDWKPRPFRNALGRQHLRDRKILISREQACALTDYWKFCFVRNPWDRLVSCYSQKIRPDRVAGHLGKFGRTFHRGMTFQAFAEAVCEIPDSEADRHFCSQFRYITDEGGALLVDFVGYYESLFEDYQIVSRPMIPAEVALPHLLKSDHPDYRGYYADSLAERVGRRYSTDNALLGYSFTGEVQRIDPSVLRSGNNSTAGI